MNDDEQYSQREKLPLVVLEALLNLFPLGNTFFFLAEMKKPKNERDVKRESIPGNLFRKKIKKGHRPFFTPDVIDLT